MYETIQYAALGSLYINYHCSTLADHQLLLTAGNFLLVFVGTITGVGGGLLRDMMSESIPYIFQKHIYATACIVGAVICVIFYRKLNISLNISMIVGAIAVLVIRALAAQLRWNLPTVHLDEEGKS